jgi:soluble lytic murein transglycosylase-like protein
MSGDQQELFTLPLESARCKAREIIDQAPRGGLRPTIEKWRQLPDGQIEFAIRHFPAADWQSHPDRGPDAARTVRARKRELLADGPDEKVWINRSGRPVTPLIEAHIVCCRGTYVTCFANADGRANGVDKALIYAVVADPGRQISRRYCGAADKGWLLILRRQLILSSGGVRENQKRW